MNYLDVLIVISLVYFSFKGFKNGIIKEVTGLLALVLGVYIAITFSSKIHEITGDIILGYEEYVPIISFSIFFVSTFFLVKIIGNMTHKISHILALGLFSRVFGFLFGVLKTLIVFSFVFSLIEDYYYIDEKIKKESVLIEPTQKITTKIIPKIKKNQI